MASVAVPPPKAFARPIAPPSLVVTFVLIVAALILRGPHFGDPSYHVDEAFYLHVGDQMLKGAIPYIDIWDRKPVGLFVLYAGIRLLGGDGILQYQLAAFAAVVGTAFLIALLARRQCGWTASCAAGIVYIAYLEPLWGGGGQTPIFYNLLVAGAALLVVRAGDAGDVWAIARRGVAAMLLCGVAIQIKYPVVAEGCFFGLVLLWQIWTRTRRFADLVKWGAVFAACGLLPTAAAIGVYAAIGHLDAFWFANFTSILLRPITSNRETVGRLLNLAVILTPLIVISLGTVAARARAKLDAQTLFLILWIGAALLGFGLIGTFYRHYALPLLVPFCVAAAPLFDRRSTGPFFAALLVIWSMLLWGYPGWPARESRQATMHLAESVRENLGDGCLYMYDGPPILFHLANACYVSPYVFPYHLNSAVETTGLGVDPSAELRRILARRPTVIVTASRPAVRPNRANDRIIRAALRRDYRPVDVQNVRGRVFIVHSLNDRSARR